MSLRAKAFFAGFVAALAVCSALGYALTANSIFEHFGRFHTRLAPDSSFLPTARQVRALAFAVLDKGKINVVVGGSSVFYGVGQPEGMTITDNLRRELGDDYRVINLAMRGGDLTGMAEQTVEMLMLSGYKVIYLSDLVIGGPPQLLGSSPYQYFYWDARARGYLMSWPPRDQAVGEMAWLEDRAIGGWLNSVLNFNDLWGTIAYKDFFTVYTTLVPTDFWRPRRTYPDNEIDVARSAVYRGDLQADMAIVHASSVPHSEAAWQEVSSGFETAVPATVRQSTVVALCENSPFFFDRATAALVTSDSS